MSRPERDGYSYTIDCSGADFSVTRGTCQRRRLPHSLPHPCRRPIHANPRTPVAQPLLAVHHAVRTQASPLSPKVIFPADVPLFPKVFDRVRTLPF